MKPYLQRVMSFIVPAVLAVALALPALALDEVKGKDLGLVEGNDLVKSITTIANIFLGLLGITALIFIVIGGVTYITSGDNESNQEKAKHRIMYAVIGLIVVGLAAVIVNFTINAFSGGAGGGQGPP